MKKYNLFVNESIFGNFFGKKKKEEEPKAVKIEKKNKSEKESDAEMISLINDIKSNFDITNLKYLHKSKVYLIWVYNHNGVEIKMVYETEYKYHSNERKLYIDNKNVSLEYVSDYLVEDLANFFMEQEKLDKIKKNSEIFNTIAVKTGQKYNL